MSKRDDVNPSKNRTLGALVEDVVLDEFAITSDEIMEARSMPFMIALRHRSSTERSEI
jgi:hypothetical protein